MFLYLVAPPLFKTVSHFMNSLVQTTRVSTTFVLFLVRHFLLLLEFHPKKSLKSQNLMRHWENYSGTLPFSRHISVGSRTLPVGYPSIRAVVSVPYAWSWQPCWRSMRTDGRRPAICWIIRSSEDKHGAAWVFFKYRGKMIGKIYPRKKKRPVSNGDHENYCHFFWGD